MQPRPPVPRALRGKATFLAVVLGTLALSLGASVAMFGVVHTFYYAALPYADADRLVLLWRTQPSAKTHPIPGSASRENEIPLSPGDFLDLRAEGRSFETLSALLSEFGNVTGAGEPERIHVMDASPDLFRLLGARAALGRTLGPQDEEPGATPVLVLSHAFWRRRFGADRRAVGRTLELFGRTFEIVGVLPATFRLSESLTPLDPSFSQPVDAWLPLRLRRGERERGFHFVTVLGRLRAGASVRTAQEEARLYAARIGALYPDIDQGYGLGVVPLRDQIFGHLRPTLLTLLAATGFVLLIACANLATLLLARSEAAQHDIAVRLALGASRRRIFARSLSESLGLALAGGLLALLLAQAATRLLRVLSPLAVFQGFPIQIEGRVFAFALGSALLAGFLFGGLPAWRASRVSLTSGLKAGGVTRAGRSGPLLLALVVAEIALTTTLLLAAGLAVRSFVGLVRADLGVEAERVLAMDLNLPFSRYREPARRAALLRELLERVRHLPSVESASLNYALPLRGVDPSNAFAVEGRPLNEDEQLSANLGQVDGDYFRTLGIPLLQGRTFLPSDREGSTPVAIVDARMVRELFAGKAPLGRRLRIEGDELLTIVGVVGSVRQNAFEERARPYIYVPFFQHSYLSTTLALKTAKGGAPGLVAAIRRAVRHLDSDLPVSNVATLGEAYRAALAPQRTSLVLVSIFAALALLLTLLGIYGVTSFLTRQRRREIGIRLALGAAPGQVRGLLLRQGLRLSLTGVALGLALALLLGHLLEAFVYGIRATDPLVFAVVPLLTGLAALVAYAQPVRTLSRVDPRETLRGE